MFTRDEAEAIVELDEARANYGESKSRYYSRLQRGGDASFAFQAVEKANLRLQEAKAKVLAMAKDDPSPKLIPHMPGSED